MCNVISFSSSRRKSKLEICSNLWKCRYYFCGMERQQNSIINFHFRWSRTNGFRKKIWKAYEIYYWNKPSFHNSRAQSAHGRSWLTRQFNNTLKNTTKKCKALFQIVFTSFRWSNCQLLIAISTSTIAKTKWKS